MPIMRGRRGVRQVLREFKAGTLHSGSPKGPVVRSRKQAVAIALKQAGLSRARKRSRSRRRSR